MIRGKLLPMVTRSALRAARGRLLRSSSLWRGSTLLAGLYAVRAVVRWRRRISFTDKVVLVTGGSRGLGLELARLLADERARLVLLARSELELARAREELLARGAEVLTLPCDLGDPVRAAEAVREAAGAFGPIDVLINNAGVIQVGPFDEMTQSDFAEAMAIHFWAPLHLTLAVLPEMRRRRAGRIVNVTSIGGRVAVPHLAPYVASKFALVGLSAALRAELAREGVLVTTVVPGLMRTGSHVNASFKGRHRDEYAWFSIGGALPLFSIDAERAAAQILDAARHGDAHRTITLQARALELAQALAPGLIAAGMQLANRALPGPDGVGREARAGRESASRWSPSLLTRLSDRAAGRNNE